MMIHSENGDFSIDTAQSVVKHYAHTMQTLCTCKPASRAGLHSVLSVAECFSNPIRFSADIMSTNIRSIKNIYKRIGKHSALYAHSANAVVERVLGAECCA